MPNEIGVFGKGAGARRLAETLGVRLQRVVSGRASGDVHPVMVRWKTTRAAPRGTRVEFNSREAVQTASHKRRSLEVMRGAGVRVPQFSRNINDLYAYDFIFGRANYHTKGQDILVYRVSRAMGDYCEHCGRGQLGETQFGIDTGLSICQDQYHPDYYIGYLRPEKEYRYHVAFGKIILPTVKMKEDGSYSDDNLIRNHQDGEWRQVACREVVPEYGEQCVKAVEALGLDFGAVDFIVHSGECYVLEVNTAPGLEVDNRLEAYKRAFVEEMERRRRG